MYAYSYKSLLAFPLRFVKKTQCLAPGEQQAPRTPRYASETSGSRTDNPRRSNTRTDPHIICNHMPAIYSSSSSNSAVWEIGQL